MSGLELFGHRAATCSQRVLFTAYELDEPFKFTKIDFATAQHKSPEFLKRQPFGKVPAAEWDGQPFYEPGHLPHLRRGAPGQESAAA